MEFWNEFFLVEISGHKLEPSQTRDFLSGFLPSFFRSKMLFMNRLKFSYFTDYFVRPFKTQEE
jgi:hypothetical protein